MRQTLWSRVYDIISPYKTRMFVSLATLLVLTGLGLLSPVFASKLVGKALPEGNRDLFVQCIIMLVIIHVISSAISFAY